MEQSRTDPCVFRMFVDSKIELIMAVHVDDIVIAGSDEACRDFHAALSTKFSTNNLGELNWYTGCAFKLFFFFILQRMGKNKALAHHTSTHCFQAQLGIGHVGDHAEGLRWKHAESFWC